MAEPSCSQQLMETRKDSKFPPLLLCRTVECSHRHLLRTARHSGITQHRNCSTERIRMDSAGPWRCIKHFATKGQVCFGTAARRKGQGSPWYPGSNHQHQPSPRVLHILTSEETFIAKKSWESRKAPKSCQMRHIQFANHVNHVNLVSALMWSSS